MSSVATDVPSPEELAAKLSSPFVDPLGTDPIRAELHGLDSLKARARQIAAAPAILRARPAGPGLLERFRENARILRRAHRRIVTLVRDDEPLTPAAEWL